MDFLTQARWSPYIVGGLIGLLNVIALIVSNKVIGTSTTYAKVSGMVGKKINPAYVAKNEFFIKTTPNVDWGVMLVLGIVIGSFVSAYMSSDFSLQWVPGLWASLISQDTLLRLLLSVVGGLILGIGSRWAGGCTSGHGISGTAQLSPISIVAAMAFFVGGILSAALFYGL